jgi:hypothetical protein
MADIAMCRDVLCKSKETCYRFKAIPDNYRQSYLIPNREEDAVNCSMYWEYCNKCHQFNGVHKLSCSTKKIEIRL